MLLRAEPLGTVVAQEPGDERDGGAAARREHRRRAEPALTAPVVEERDAPVDRIDHLVVIVLADDRAAVAVGRRRAAAAVGADGTAAPPVAREVVHERRRADADLKATRQPPKRPEVGAQTTVQLCASLFDRGNTPDVPRL